MRNYQVFSLAAPFLVTLGALMVLPGCGNSGYESDKDFLDSLPIEGTANEDVIGTLPPIDVPMGQIAKIRVETTELDMGIIANDEQTHRKFMVYNDGGMPLKLTRVDTTCACTQGQISPESSLIQGGEAGWIDVVLDPRRIPGFHSEKVLTITSTDPETPNVEVTVTAQVDPEYDIGSDEIDLGDIPKGEAFEKRIRFRQLIDRPVNVTDLQPLVPGIVESGDSGFTTAVEEIPEAEWQTPGHREYDLIFMFEPSMPAGPFVRYARLFTDIERTNRHRLTFTGTVIAPYTAFPAYPDRAEFMKPAGKKAYETHFVFTAGTPITVANIVPRIEALKAEAVPGQKPNEVVVNVTFEGEPETGVVFDETLDIELIVDGKSYTEKVGAYINPNPGMGGHGPGDGHNH